MVSLLLWYDCNIEARDREESTALVKVTNKWERGTSTTPGYRGVGGLHPGMWEAEAEPLESALQESGAGTR